MDDTAEAVKVAFDKRVDQIGLAEEIVSQYAKPLRDDVKARMESRGAERAEGSLFDAILVSGETRTIDPAALLKLYDQKKIDRDHLLSAITVKPAACEKFLSREVVDGLSDKKQTLSLRITRKKGVAVALLDCLTGIGKALAGKK